MICEFCKVEKTKNDSQWWILHRYKGFHGNCCPQCYECVEHDPWDKPCNPEKYSWFVLKYAK